MVTASVGLLLVGAIFGQDAADEIGDKLGLHDKSELLHGIKETETQKLLESKMSDDVDSDDADSDVAPIETGTTHHDPINALENDFASLLQGVIGHNSTPVASN